MLLLFAKYGRKELAFFSVVWMGVGAALWLAHPAASAAALAGLLFTLFFFRDPFRTVPSGDGLLVSPADGTVVEISEVDEGEYLNARCHKIGIFLSVFNVHVNRSPCAGTVRAVRYVPGMFRDARSPGCGSVNESNTVQVGDVVVRQIAGALARRIVCEAKPDDILERGQKFGMIKFGSRTEILIPKDLVREISVKPKDKVKGGETVLARIR